MNNPSMMMGASGPGMPPQGMVPGVSGQVQTRPPRHAGMWPLFQENNPT